MLRSLLSAQITRMERTWNYDATYMRELLAVSPWAFLRFGLVAGLGRGRRAPAGATSGAGIAATLTEDCGPCVQTGVDMALRAGVAADDLRAILLGDEAAMSETARIGYRFAVAVLGKDLETADTLRMEIVRRWGKEGLMDISLAMTTARMYPTLKYALGHGRACSRMQVAGAQAGFQRPRALAA